MISIIIVAYNGRQFIDKLIRSIGKQTYRDLELIVIDNNSKEDNCLLYFNSDIRTTYIELSENNGFAYAVNTGIQYASGKYIVVLNNDIYLDHHFMQVAYNAMRSNKGIFFAPIVYSYDGSMVDSAGDSINREYKPYKCTNIVDHEKQYRIDAMSMSACFFRKSDYSHAGGMNNNFFLYFEDAEFSLRARRMGFAFCLDPKAKAYHYISASTKAITGTNYSPMKTFYEARNRILLLKSEKRINILKNSIFIIAGTISSIIYHTIKTHYYLDYIAGLFAGILELHRI